MNVQEERGEEDLKSRPFPDGFILPGSEEDGIDIGYCTVLIVFASFLICVCQLLRQKTTTSDTQPTSHK